jgi:hypothetical protein
MTDAIRLNPDVREAHALHEATGRVIAPGDDR